ncbi:MAG: CBS domain-containing protein [Deltaproteobacteria bacterium]|nr:CBS domain-containing protein [Deltaproteobacteria bacterium]
MRTKKVEEIILPYKDSVPLEPSVNIGDKIIDAIELMVSNDIRYIAIVRNRRPIGMIRLEDAFQKLGLQLSQKK